MNSVIIESLQVGNILTSIFKLFNFLRLGAFQPQLRLKVLAKHIKPLCILLQSFQISIIMHIHCHLVPFWIRSTCISNLSLLKNLGTNFQSMILSQENFEYGNAFFFLFITQIISSVSAVSKLDWCSNYLNKNWSFGRSNFFVPQAAWNSRGNEITLFWKFLYVSLS